MIEKLLNSVLGHQHSWGMCLHYQADTICVNPDIKQQRYSSSVVTLCCTFKHILRHSERWVLTKTDFWIELETTCGNRSNSLYQCPPGRNSPKLCNSHNYIDLSLRMDTDTFRFTNLQSKHSTEAQFFQNKIIDVYRYCNDMSSDWVA